MLDYREILRLNSLGYTNRQIARTGVASRDKVKEVLDAADNTHIKWPLDDAVTNEDLKQLMFPHLGSRTMKVYAEPDYAHIHSELARPGVTLTLLWKEYCDACYNGGQTPYMSTQFNEKYRKWARVTKATMRIQHKPGDAMQVDWAGNTIPIYDSVTGEETAAYLFVAVLPCSCYAYAEACGDMKSENWLLCHVHAFHYFGGVPRLLIPDNLKTGVTANTHYDTVLNRSYQELAEHYGTAIVPTRVRRPKDKSLAEGTVKFASTWIIAALRNRKFFSVEEAQTAVLEQLEQLNARPFQKRDGSRRSAYLEEERSFLHPLPTVDYEPAVWNVAAVSSDYLISDGINHYSVPFDLIGEKVDIRLTRNTVEVFYHGSRVASHHRLQTMQRNPVINPEHMTPEHRKYLHYNSDDFTMWADTIGPKTSQVVQYFLSCGKAPEQGYKACASLTRLADKYGKHPLETACERVLAYASVPSIRNISIALRNGTAKPLVKTRSGQQSPGKSYGITRGASYYARKDGKTDD